MPEYLSYVPLDPFDGKPIRYIAAAGIVYSVGYDLIDSSGSLNGLESWSGDGASSRRWKADDAVFHVTTEGEASSTLVKKEEEP